jgi:hypothetical protein
MSACQHLLGRKPVDDFGPELISRECDGGPVTRHPTGETMPEHDSIIMRPLGTSGGRPATRRTGRRSTTWSFPRHRARRGVRR